MYVFTGLARAHLKLLKPEPLGPGAMVGTRLGPTNLRYL